MGERAANPSKGGADAIRHLGCCGARPSDRRGGENERAYPACPRNAASSVGRRRRGCCAPAVTSASARRGGGRRPARRGSGRAGRRRSRPTAPARACSARRRLQTPAGFERRAEAARRRPRSRRRRSPSSAETARTGTSPFRAPAGGSGAARWRIRRRCGGRASASSPSALLTRIRSASSMMPRFSPCNSSPAAGGRISTNMSTISATAVSDWPAPTVSTMHRVEPGRLAHQDRLAGAPRDAARARPGRGRADEGGRARAPVRPSASCRRGSRRRRASTPGSTASTAIRGPSAMPSSPKRSIKVDLPAPGGPEMPIRVAAAGLRQDRVEQRLGLGAMVGPGRFRRG